MVCKIVGFSVLSGGNSAQVDNFHEEHTFVLQNFPWLSYRCYKLSGLILIIWGHGDIDSLVYGQKDVNKIIFLTNVSKVDIDETRISRYFEQDISCDPDFPWEGIANLVIIDENVVSVTNDWTGASKIFSSIQDGLICISSLESVVFKVVDPSESDIDHVAVYALMSGGAYYGDQTLYKNIRVQIPDSTKIYRKNSRELHRRWSIYPSEERWTRGWQELVDEWAELIDGEITSALGKRRDMNLLLSGGIDSRIIAAIAAEKGYPINAISYGNSSWQDGIQAKKIAKKLHIPFRLVNIGLDYLKVYTRVWIEWFGASMSLHGVYQMPGLFHLRERFGNYEILTGFTGDPLEGMQMESLMSGQEDSLLERFFKKNHLWSDEKLAKLMPWLDVKKCRQELESNLQEQYLALKGADFQRMWLLFQWNRVFQFSSYQPIMYEYFCGSVTPFVRRNLAKFTLSLPRAVLERRRLFYDVIKKRYPQIAKLPGTYDHPAPIFDFIPSKYGIPFLLTKSYMFKAAIGYLLPNFLRVGIFREFSPTSNLFSQGAIKKYQLESLYPIDDFKTDQQTLFDEKEINKFIKNLLSEEVNIKPSMKAWPIQTLITRLVLKR